MGKPSYQIEHWRIVFHDNSYYRLEGLIKGRSPEILEWESAYTSKLVAIDFKNNQAETINSFYSLGECFEVSVAVNLKTLTVEELESLLMQIREILGE